MVFLLSEGGLEKITIMFINNMSSIAKTAKIVNKKRRANKRELKLIDVAYANACN